MSAPAILLGARGEVISSPEIRRRRSIADLRAKYDAAQTTTENTRHWANADYLGPNSELDPGVRRVLRSRARYECANNTYANGMVRTLANDTIGTGPGLQITQKNVSAADVATAEDIFWDWCLASDFAAKLRMIRRAKARDGEGCGQFLNNYALRHAVKLDLLPFECDLIASNYFSTSIAQLLDGLFVDDFGNVIAYNVLRDHPGERSTVLDTEAELVPASEIIFLPNTERAGQYRGVPEFTSALPLYAQLRRYTLAVIRAAESAAIPSWIIETQGVPDDGIDPFDPLETVDTERGMGMVMPGGWKANQLKAEHPTSTYPQFKREIIAEIARCLNMPYNVAAGDSSSYNYSSGRLDHRTYYKQIRVERSMFEARVLDVVFAKWWAEATKISGLLPDIFYRAPVPAHTWRWDGDEHVDPTKEADAAVTRIANGLSSFADEGDKLGVDIAVVHQKNAAVLRLSEDEYAARLAAKILGPAPAAAPAVEDDDGETNPSTSAVEEVSAAMDAYGVGVRAGAITPTTEDEHEFRKRLNLPALSPNGNRAWKEDGGFRRPITLQPKEPKESKQPSPSPERDDNEQEDDSDE